MLRHEPPGVVELARAVAVLEPDADAGTRARVAGLDDVAAAHAAERLVELGVLDGHRCGHDPARTAVLEAAGADRCRRLHARAARVLDSEGAPLDRVADHHLAAGPPRDGGVVELLHVAAARAEQRGDRVRARRLLEHTLTGPVGGRRRAALLVDLSVVERVAAPATARGHLVEALSLLPCARERAELLARTVARSPGGAVDLAPLLEDVLRDLADAGTGTSGQDRELRQRLEALVLHAACEDPSGAARVWEWVARTDPGELGAGAGADVLRSAHLLFSALALHTDATTAAARTAEAMPADLEDDAYLHPMQVAALGLLCWAEATTGLDGVRRRTLDAAHRTHRTDVEAFLRGVDAMLLLRRGQVPAALAAARASLDVLTGATRLMVLRAATLALVELGRTAEAERLLAPVDDRSSADRTWRWNYLLDARAAVLAATGRTREALALTLECGHRLMAVGIVNPVVLDWRRRAVELHHELGEHEAATAAAEEYVTLCRLWGPEGYGGAALRVLGLVQGGERGLATLHSARAELGASPLALDRARCTVDLGARMRAHGAAGEARALLRHGLELAADCGAPILAARARTELAAAGGRPRRGGSSSLTPAELGVARLAAGGATNRDIAAVLGTSQRAVEGHLTRVYRKLEIDGREGLASAPGLRVGTCRPGGQGDVDAPTRAVAPRP